MEEKKTSKIGYVICIIIILLLVVGLGYACYMIGSLNQQLSEKDNTMTNNTIEATNTMQETISNNNSTSSMKVDANKDWIYDAEYEKNVSFESIKTEYDEEYYAKDIVVPYININSDDARSANNEIKKNFNEAIEKFNEKRPTEWNYKSYINDSTLSVIISSKNSIELDTTLYYSYNFDLKTGNKLNYKEICELVKSDSDSIYSKAEEKILKYLKDNYYKNGDNEGSEWSFSNMYSESVLNYSEAVQNETLKFFIGDNNKLNIVVWLRTPTQLMEHNEIIEID